MSETRMPGPLARRSFLSRMGAGAAAFGAAFGAGSWTQAQSAPKSTAAASPWTPVRHPEDDWFDQPTAKHRFFLDTTTPEAFAQALTFARNFYTGNANGYGLADADIAQIICARHRSTAFAFNDAMWAKYGKPFAERIDFTDPKTKQTPATNYYGAQLTALVKQGVHLGVCNLTTRSLSQRLAELTGKTQDETYQELTTNTVGNAHFVPAGVLGVTRAQEHGYALISIG